MAADSLNFDPYTKYETYPEYCSTPSQMERRTIKPIHQNTLHSEQQQQPYETKLLQVTAIIRHGARTPSKAHKCWDDFWKSSSDTSIWNCELTTLVASPAQPAVLNFEKNENGSVTSTNSNSSVHNDEQLDGEGTIFLFDKRYDALDDAPQLRNELNGTCQVGQLLLRGYVQELHNGNMLRKTYIRDTKDNYTIDDSMVLFDLDEDPGISSENSSIESGGSSQHRRTTKNNERKLKKLRPYEEPNLYYRADDDQRTLMSGQVLLRGLFEDLLHEHSKELGSHVDPTVIIHTADRNRDILSRNSDICPLLNDLEDDAKNSKDYLNQFVNSEESRILNELMENELGGNFQTSALDCMMSTICTDRQLPLILDDYGKDLETNELYGSDFFDRIQKYSYLPKNYVLRYNQSAYSKLATGPLWVDILSNILPLVPASEGFTISNDLKENLRYPPPKLALFSAHDSTLHMLLSSLGEKIFGGEDWAPFASYLVIELHDIIEQIAMSEVQSPFPSGKAFRLVYNGEVLTSKIDGCGIESSPELCDISFLVDTVSSFAVNKRNCDARIVQKEVNSTAQKEENNNCLEMGSVFDTNGGILTFGFSSLVSALLGSLITYYLMTRHQRSSCKRETGQRYERFEKKNCEHDETFPDTIELPDMS